MSEWVLKGDINFLEFGGRIIRQSEYDPSVYDVIEVWTPWDSEEVPDGSVRAFAADVDLDDSWLDMENALRASGIEDTDVDDYTKVDALISYWGIGQWDPMPLGDDEKNLLTIDDFAEILRARGAGEFC